MCQMSVTYSKSKGLYKEGIRIQCFFKHDATTTTALSAVRHDHGFISLDFHDDNGVHFIQVTDKDIDFLMFCDDSQTAFDYALSLIPPSENTDTKSEIAKGESVGVVDSVGDALSLFVTQTDNFEPLNNLVLDVDGRKYSLTIADLRTIGNALQIYHNHNSETDWGWNDETNEKEIKLKHISDLRDQFRNIQNYYSVEHQAWIQACENGSIFESGIFDKAE